VAAVFTFLAAGVAAWLSYELTAGLPRRDAITGIGNMAQATTIYDAGDKPVFSIFKEQRIEIADLERGIAIAKELERDVILICACKSFDNCHRKPLSEALREQGHTVEELQ